MFKKTFNDALIQMIVRITRDNALVGLGGQGLVTKYNNTVDLGELILIQCRRCQRHRPFQTATLIDNANFLAKGYAD